MIIWLASYPKSGNTWVRSILTSLFFSKAIPTPKIVDKLVKTIPFGSFLYSTQIREKLANNYNAEMTCPVVTGISMRILSEAAFEEFEIHNNIGKITPFWRIVEPDSKLAGKLACGIDFIAKRHTQENIVL